MTPARPRAETRLLEFVGGLKALGFLVVILSLPDGLHHLLSYRAMAFLPDWVWASLFGLAAVMQPLAVLRRQQVARLFAAMALGSLFFMVAASIAEGPFTPTLVLAAGEGAAETLCALVLLLRVMRR